MWGGDCGVEADGLGGVLVGLVGGVVCAIDLFWGEGGKGLAVCLFVCLFVACKGVGGSGLWKVGSLWSFIIGRVGRCDWMGWVGQGGWLGVRTPSIAFLTRSEFMRPFLARLAMRPALLEPEENQAMFFSSDGGCGCGWGSDAR